MAKQTWDYPPDTPIYNRAMATIDACHAVDEVEQIDDPVEKLRAYARMAQNLEPELQASLIRLRAEKAVKKLLKAAKA